MSRSRGRPRKFDAEQALGNALLVFWTNGFTGTSLDQLADAMEMKRPSIYNAFGDKEALYRAALNAFKAGLEDGLQELSAADDIEQALNHFFTRALDVYTSGATPMGCFIFCTAPAEAIAHPEVRNDMLAITSQIDHALARVFTAAQAGGQLPSSTDPVIAAQLTQATLHSLALRSRAGQSRSTLDAMARGAVKMICR